MERLQHNLVEFGGQKNLTVVFDGQMFVADSTHPNWDRIYQAVVVDKDENANYPHLFDVQAAITAKFNRVSERVSVRNGKVFLDGDEQDNALTKQILKFLDQDLPDWQPLVAFMEKVQNNPEDHSREQLFDFLVRREFTITNDGDILGYKGVRKETAEDGTVTYWSQSQGTAIVNGEVKEGYIPQQIGDVVEMPRSKVAHNPAADCSTGLHVSHWRFARDFGHSAVLLVRVNPRDVVSVPTDASYQKVRVCRYEVIEEVTSGDLEKEALYQPKHLAPEGVEDVLPEDQEWDDEDEFEDDDSWDSWDDDDYDDYEDDWDSDDDEDEDEPDDAEDDEEIEDDRQARLNDSDAQTPAQDNTGTFTVVTTHPSTFTWPWNR